MRLVAFCEAPADFRLAAGLVDRVLGESGPAWVVDNLESPDVIRTWQPDGFGRGYFDVHVLNQYMDELRVRSVRGHFNGRPGGAGGSMARKAFLIARALSKKAPAKPINAVVVLWDADQQRGERPEGVAAAQTREEQQKLALLRSLASEAFDQLDQGGGIEINGQRQLANFIGKIGGRAAKSVKRRAARGG